MRIRTGWVTAILAAIVTLTPPQAWAQYTSAIEGTVADPSGALVPGATVTAINEGTGTTFTAQTTNAGYYRFPSLQAGLYSIKVELEGFKTVTRQQVRLAAVEVKTINVTLELGSASEQVTVTAATPLVETAQARVSGLIEENQIKDLPLIGRNFFNLVVLTPGVTGRATGGGQAYAQSQADLYSNEFSVGMNANGARTESNNFLIDSSTVSSSQRSGVVNINPNAESVEEVRVSVNNFSAEHGRNGSVLVNIITKSGTNNLRGSAGIYYTNDALQAKNEFQKRPGFRHPDFGRTELSWGVGGPVQRDRTFFFLSGDVLRSQVAIAGDRSIVTPDFVRFMEQSRPNNVSTYMMRTFPASFTPDRNFRTAGQHLGVACSGSTPIASPVGSIPCNLPVTGVGTWNETSPRNGLQLTARVDHHFNGGTDRLYGSFNRTTTDKVGFGEPSVYPAFTAPSPTSSMHANSNWTRIIGSNLLNELTFSWVRPWGELTNPRPDVPGISVTGIVGYQTGWGPNEFVQNSFEWRDVISWTRGSHSMKVGGGYTREHADNDSAPSHHRAIYNFDTVFDFAADTPTSQGQLAIDPRTGTPVTTLRRFHRTQSVSAFVQDDWKVRPNLTLNAGVRYEGFLNIYDAAGPMANIEFTTSGDLRTQLADARVVERKYYLEGGLWSGGMHTFAPRAGFAWDPANNGKLSIRGGWGRSYDRMSNQIWDSEHLNLPGFAIVSGSTSTPLTRPVFGLGRNTEPPYGFPYPTGVSAGLNEHGGLLNGRGLVHVVDPNIDPMYLDNWFLGMQRGIGRNIAIEADYIGSRGRNAYRKQDINRFNGDLLDGRFDGILPGFDPINFTDASDESSYHGVTFGLKVHRSDLQVGTAYTYGKATDFSSSFSAPSRPDAYGPPEQDKGPADFDVRQKVAVSAIWQMPSPSAGAMKALLGGWQAGGVLIAQSGVPFTVVCGGRAFTPIRDAAGNIVGNSGCDYNADFRGPDRPDIPSFGASLSGLSNDDFLNGIFRASDFPTPAPGRPGTLGRNTFRGPRYFNVDLALIKSVRVPFMTGRPSDMQLRLEAFNALNTLNLNNPIAVLTDPLFGRSTSALPGRILQLSARFGF